MSLKSSIAAVLGRSPIGYWPVHVRAGLAKGAKWTLLPHSAYWRGTFEPDVDAAVARLGDLTGACCWDLGTHFGLYTVGLGRAVGPTGQVVGFEPDPVSYARCQFHVHKNGLTWVKLYQAAASDTTGTGEMLTYGGFGMTTTHLRFDGEKGVGATVHPIRRIAPDDLVASGEIRAPRLVKIDVEGHGEPALRGMRKTVLDRRPHLLMSFHCPSEAQAARDLLANHGYQALDCRTGAPAAPPADDFLGTLHLAPEGGPRE